MYQSDRGNYRKEESLFGMFFNSCLGKIVILLAVLGLLALIAYITCPSQKYMRSEMMDNIKQCIERNDSTAMDKLDNALANIGYMFSSTDPKTNKDLMETFKKYNRTEIYDHGIYSTMLVFNNYNLDGVRCGIGIFGMVIPTLSYSDLIMRIDPVGKTYEKKTIELPDLDTLIFGEIPDLVFQEEDY